ncbi:hypothetical protein [Janthinobacterium fluminis]|uniref:Uncharacterized protein n=1 Tax=Janthinobacterium fluminis TaxID=2987524 RepID=A0ABT5JU13_9BURK|nr:hypothetical protein [Janthinobacterium fluminis]MDC8756139.1 hypothetical protein [Janthinobacterium fluminis]
MNPSTILASCLLTALPAAALADSVPPPQWEADGMQAVYLPAKPVSKLAMGRFSVDLEKTTLQQIKSALGAGIITHEGGARDSRYWLCYTVPAGAAAERVWLIAGPGGAGQRVTMVHALQQPALRPSAGCPQLPRSFLPLRFDKDIWLRQASAKVARVFGPASVNAHERWSYAYTGKTTLPYKGGTQEVELNNRIELQIRNGAVSAIIATQSSGD